MKVWFRRIVHGISSIVIVVELRCDRCMNKTVGKQGKSLLCYNIFYVSAAVSLGTERKVD